MGRSHRCTCSYLGMSPPPPFLIYLTLTLPTLPVRLRRHIPMEIPPRHPLPNTHHKPKSTLHNPPPPIRLRTPLRFRTHPFRPGGPSKRGEEGFGRGASQDT